MTYLPKDLVVVPKASLEALTGIVKIESIPLEPLMSDAYKYGFYSPSLDPDDDVKEYFKTPIEFKP